jgi:hypothetical protein
MIDIRDIDMEKEYYDNLWKIYDKDRYLTLIKDFLSDDEVEFIDKMLDINSKEDTEKYKYISNYLAMFGWYWQDTYKTRIKNLTIKDMKNEDDKKLFELCEKIKNYMTIDKKIYKIRP